MKPVKHQPQTLASPTLFNDHSSAVSFTYSISPRDASLSTSPEQQHGCSASLDEEEGTGHLESPPPQLSNRRASHSTSSHASRRGREANKRRYQCMACCKLFSRPSALKTHTYTHTGEKPNQCTFPGCGRRFAVVSNLRRHFKVHKKPAVSNRLSAEERVRQVQRLMERSQPSSMGCDTASLLESTDESVMGLAKDKISRKPQNPPPTPHSHSHSHSHSHPHPHPPPPHPQRHHHHHHQQQQQQQQHQQQHQQHQQQHLQQHYGGHHPPGPRPVGSFTPTLPPPPMTPSGPLSSTSTSSTHSASSSSTCSSSSSSSSSSPFHASVSPSSSFTPSAHFLQSMSNTSPPFIHTALAPPTPGYYPIPAYGPRYIMPQPPCEMPMCHPMGQADGYPPPPQLPSHPVASYHHHLSSMDLAQPPLT